MDRLRRVSVVKELSRGKGGGGRGVGVGWGLGCGGGGGGGEEKGRLYIVDET